jgi:hypothetical protein
MADLDPELPDDVVRVADGVGDRQLLAPGIEQVDRECLEVRDARDEQRDLVSNSSRLTDVISVRSSNRVMMSSRVEEW